MKFCAIGDIHSLHDQLTLPKDIDLVLCAGDITEHGTNSEMSRFVEWLQEQKAPHKIVIAGNHDRCLEKEASFWKKTFAKSNITYLENQMVTIGGVRIYGSPYIPCSGFWSFQKKTRQELIKNWEQIPASCDILLTHGPPYGILDKHHGKNIGDPDLAEFCRKLIPKFHIFGHVHAATGHYNSTFTQYINCACKKELVKRKFTPNTWQVTP